METRYIIYDIRNNEFFIGCNDDGKPMFGNLIEDKPISFDSEDEAISRLYEEIELFGDLFLENKIIEIKRVITF